MAAPPTSGPLRLDDFNRANGSVGAAYGIDPDNNGYGDWNVASNRAVPSGNFSAVWFKTLFPADQEVTMTIVTLPPSGGFRLYARIQNPGTAGHSQWELECGTAGGNSFISKHVAGTRTTVRVTGVSFAAGDKMTLRCTGDQIIVLKNYIEVDRITDNSVPGAGYVGFASQNDSAVVVDDLYGSAPTSPLLTPAPAPNVLTLGDPNS